MIIRKSNNELRQLEHCNKVVMEILFRLMEQVRPGISTLDLEREADEKIRSASAKSAFKGYRGFPACLCTSVNEEIVHGIPSADSILQEGDIVSLDLGISMGGYYGDAAITLPVGQISEAAEQLLDVTEASLYHGAQRARVGQRLSDVSHAIQSFVEGEGFSVIRDFVGHGIGSALHEDPQIPNFGSPGKGPRLKPGMVFAIEPMVTQGGHIVRLNDDQWTAVTANGGLSAHFERCIAITEGEARILGGQRKTFTWRSIE